MPLHFRLVALLFVFSVACRANASLFINELMFHPPGDADAEEWLEIHNFGPVPQDLSGARFTKGITFSIPAGTSIAAGGYLVVAADVAAFTAAHPAFAGQLVGGWTGRLSNAGETVRLESAAGGTLCEVTYADEGEWALRVRGPLSFGHRGWVWEAAADGGGRTLELRNPQLTADSGQNWGVSALEGGSPGEANSLASSDVAPLITDAKHRPEIPRSNDPIIVSCDLRDEAPAATAVLHWRLDAGTWQQFPMADADGDGDVEATIPPQNHLAVIEWYIAATDGAHTRTWPAPARTSFIGALPETFAQVTNALVQVDNNFNPAINFTLPATQPIYRLIMTNTERAELAQIGSMSGQEDSEATMNGTFISHDGTGIKTVYNAGFRNRGQGSALGPPNNFHVSFRSDDRWNDRSSMALNCRYPYAQALANALVQRAGLATQESAIVRVRVNGSDLAESTARMYGRYARSEGRGGEWAERHYPEDSEGNFYRLDDHLPGTAGVPPGNLPSGEFRWEGTNPLSYADTFWKETNKDANDYSDIIALCRIVSAPTAGGTAEQPAISNADYPAQVATVLDLDNFYRFIATDTLIGNVEGGLTSGRADDASIYRGLTDTRFRFIPHDLDTCFDSGDTVNGVTRNIFAYDGSASPGTGIVGLTRLFNHPQLAPRYYAALLDAMNTWFNNATIDPIIDLIMSGWVPLTDAVAQNRSINDIKAYIAARRTNVLAQIQQNYSFNVAGNTADTAEGYKQTTTGAATFSGTFNVARTYSITVNGQLATANYRTITTPATTAGTWSLAVPAGGGGVLAPGLNRVTVTFWDAPGGTGNALQTLSADVLYASAGQSISGVLQPPGAIALLAPASYRPGVPMLVRIDQKDASAALNRQAWNTTVNLTASNGVTISPTTVTLYNGMGSALVTVGGGTPAQAVLVARGGTAQAPNGAAPAWRFFDTGAAAAMWNTDPNFDDSAWGSGLAEMGAGDGDERTPLANVTNAARTTWYFRHKFNVADPTAFTDLTLRTLIDDGAVVYLNGSEVKRVNLPAAPAAITDTTTAPNRVAPAENTFETFTVPASALVAGENLIAVEVHQSTSRVDLSFDLELIANLPAIDPGNFTLTATAGSLVASKPVASLAGTTPVTASGTLPAGVTTWSGLVHVTGDVIVPSGATLALSAGTLVLMNGTAAPGDTNGADLIISGGTLAVNGTVAQPVSITSSDPTTRWGQIYLNGAQPTVANFLLLTRGGHAPGQGHTGRGPMWRLNGASLTFNDSAMGDGPAKALFSSGSGDFVMQRSLMARMVTGPETGDGLSVLIEDSNIQEILPHYRESNSATPDDEDCLYVHNGSNRPVFVRRSVFARCGDDVFDCLDGAISVEDTILREGWDKGMSLLNNNLTITRTLIVDCDKAIVPKSNAAVTRTITVDRCTIVSENHNTTLAPWGYSIPPSSPDPDTPSTGLYTQNKSGQSDAGATLAITATNSIILAESPILVDAPYNPANTVATYSLTRDTDTPAAPAWPGTGNTNADPLFVNQAADDYHLQAASPAIDTGDPNTADPDLSRADMGALPSGIQNIGATGLLTWSPATGPYRITANTTVPPGLTLRILAGTSVYFDQDTRLTVNGVLEVLGTPERRVTFSHAPGTIAAGDCDPIKNGVQTGPPKWGGVRVVDSMANENVVKYATFINAQGTDPETPGGSLAFLRSWGHAEGLAFSGTHLRMIYGRNSKLTVMRCVFPDMFVFDPILGRIEEPSDFLPSADNNMEPLEVKFPTSDPEVSGSNAANFPGGLPLHGHWRCYYNDFNGNRGHQDVFDTDSGRWTARDASGHQTNGQFVLDCRYNTFRGLAGDEHIDLGGDAYLASNIFERATKDQWTSDTGYSNAISSGDKGTGTTILVARNFFFDLDHAINCKAGTATIFEHNTVANFHPDFLYTFYTPNQDVKCGPINFFIPEDGSNPTYGDGAYMGFNIVSNVPHVFTGPDARKMGGVVVNDITTKIEFYHNLLDQIGDPNVGPNHPGGFFSGAYGPNTQGAPDFANAAAKDFSLKPGSLAKGTAPGGVDYGATVAEWAYIHGGPAGTTDATTVSFKIGGPGMVAYKWRLDSGAWSAPVQIGDGGIMPRATPTARQATLNLSGLAQGPHRLEVLGQDMAGNWQDADPARTLIGAAQAAPTVRDWTISPLAPLVRINEIRADSGGAADQVELYCARTSGAVDLSGWSLTDMPTVPGKYIFPQGTAILPGEHFVVTLPAGFELDKDGDAVYLYDNNATRVLQDSVVFGHQLPGFTSGRAGSGGEWTLCTPTPGAPNTAARLGDSRAVRLNEWFASGDVLYGDDWIELANPGALPVDLAGLRITDNRPGYPAGNPFPPLSFIDAGGFARFRADGNAGNLPFSLDSQQEEIALLDASGVLLDSVLFFPQRTDWSMGRDSTGALVFYELPTRGIANETTSPAYLNALAILRGLRITEIMYNPLGGNDYEFLELRNVGAAAFDLAGVRFVSGITFTFGSLTMDPGQTLLLVRNLTKFRSRYGNSPAVAGVFSGALDNSGEGLAIQLPPPYDANVLDFDFSDGWYANTDGSGRSLVVPNALVPAGVWGDRDTWIASTRIGGEPAGAAIPPLGLYADWSATYSIPAPASDGDNDGVGAVVEFGLGRDPANGLGVNGPAGLPYVTRSIDGKLELHLDLPENALATQGHGMSELTYTVHASDNLSGWSIIATKTFSTAWSGSATVSVGVPLNGRVAVTITDPMSAPLRRHVRVSVTWTP